MSVASRISIALPLSLLKRGNENNVPTAFSSMMLWALVFAADILSGDTGEAKNLRIKFMEDLEVL